MSNKIHVVHVSEVLATGILTFIHSLVYQLNDYEHTVIFRIRNLGHHIDELSNMFPSHVNLIMWESVDRSIHPINDLKASIELYRHLKVCQPDIIHLHSSKAGVLGRLVGPLLTSRNKIIYTPNGASFFRNDISALTNFFYKCIEKTCDMIAGKVICVSQSEYDGYAKLGIRPILVNNGVKVRDTLDYTEEKVHRTIRIVTVGRIVTQKNPSKFNQIATSFLNNPDVQFVWVGEGKKRDRLTSNNIEVTGWVNPDEVNRILKMSDIYLSTSDWEGLSFSTLEAMANGLPLILSSCVGNVDLIVKGKTGYLYQDIEQAIQWIQHLLDMPEDHRKNMGVTSYKHCKQHFSLNNMIDGYDQLYSRLGK